MNNCICHFSPLVSESDVILADGDLVKIDLGAHIDGFIAVVAHTFVLGATAEAPVTGRKADVIMAAHLASEAALRLVKPGMENTEVTDTTTEIGKAFDCKVTSLINQTLYHDDILTRVNSMIHNWLNLY